MITIVAARRLSPEAFGVFSLGSTLGWIVAVASDFGIQLHLARAVAQRPQDAAPLLASWLRVRLWTAAAAMVVVAIGLLAAGWRADVLGADRRARARLRRAAASSSCCTISIAACRAATSSRR